jgi:anaerobic selenocysteine-containing dehydrogenase
MSAANSDKTVLCASCDIACQLHAEVQAGRVTRIKAHSNPLLRDNICMKWIYAPKGFAHPDRVLQLRRGCQPFVPE